MPSYQLIPVSTNLIGNTQCLTIDGRALHNVLGVRRDFSTWIKSRITKYGFVEGQDFEVFHKTGENSEGGRPSQEYTLEIGMGKELCMVQNNDKGRVARRYFIECERQLLAQRYIPPLLDRLSTSKDPERKELAAMINAWVGVAPIHYAGARAIVNAHIGVKTVDDMTVTQVKQAIKFVQGKINEATKGIEQQALPALPDAGELLEPHFLRIRSLIGEIRAEQEEIYTVVRQHRADVLKGNDARRSVLVNMHTTLDKLFYALDYSLDAAQVHAKGMCRMSQI